MAEKNGRTVFIGNIPYGLTDEQIQQICATVGQVLSFRLIYDSETGRPKGFGFAEFADAETAASAVRNLDKYQIGGRELRVDYSHIDATRDEGAHLLHHGAGGAGAGGVGSAMPVNGSGPGQSSNTGLANTIGPLPPGAEIPAGLTCPDAISRTLSTLPPPQLLDILSQMKGLVMGDPGRATELLKQAPQLAYAIFQALLLLGLVDSGMIAAVVEQSASASASASATNNTTAINSQPPSSMSARPYAPPTQSSYPNYGAAPTPPVAHTPYAQPPLTQQPPAQPPAAAPALAPGQDELLRQVLSLSPADIEKLGPAERQQIMALRQQFGGMMGY